MMIFDCFESLNTFRGVGDCVTFAKMLVIQWFKSNWHLEAYKLTINNC